MPPPEQVEQAWRASLSPAHAAKQEEFDSAAAFHGTDADYASIKDALTARTTRAIEAQSHGSVRYIDRGVVNRDSVHLDALTDIDIETDSAAIQVKSGGTRELSTQMIKTSTVTGKKVIGFAPEMTDARFSWYRSRGYLIVRNLDDLLRALRDE
jgi:hypothetical protein